jgi:hypothetical protein
MVHAICTVWGHTGPHPLEEGDGVMNRKAPFLGVLVLALGLGWLMTAAVSVPAAMAQDVGEFSTGDGGGDRGGPVLGGGGDGGLEADPDAFEVDRGNSSYRPDRRPAGRHPYSPYFAGFWGRLADWIFGMLAFQRTRVL